MRLKYRELRFKNESMVARIRSMGNADLLPGITFVGFPSSLDLNGARLALTYQNRWRKELLDLIDPSRLVGCLPQLIIKRPREPEILGGEIKRRRNEPESSLFRSGQLDQSIAQQASVEGAVVGEIAAEEATAEPEADESANTEPGFSSFSSGQPDQVIPQQPEGLYERVVRDPLVVLEECSDCGYTSESLQDIAEHYLEVHESDSEDEASEKEEERQVEGLQRFIEGTQAEHVGGRGFCHEASGRSQIVAKIEDLAQKWQGTEFFVVMREIVPLAKRNEGDFPVVNILIDTLRNAHEEDLINNYSSILGSLQGIVEAGGGGRSFMVVAELIFSSLVDAWTSIDPLELELRQVENLILEMKKY